MKNNKFLNSRAQGILEFAMVLPLFLLMILFTFDLGRLIFYQSLIHNAAREGARYASVDPTYTTAYDLVVDYTRLLDPTKRTIDVDFSPCEDADCTVSVTIDYNVKPVTPILPIFMNGSEVQLTTASTMRLEP